MQSTPVIHRGAGFGLGLRTEHYADFLAARQPLDWLEIITDNYLVEGGRPLQTLDTLRRDYPMAMHGVALSIGAPGGVDPAYLRQVKALADRIEPLWVSDHLCWIGPGPEQLHDLYPLPYTDEAARHVIAQIRRSQDLLQRRLVLENVSSYIDYRQSAASEWQFLAHIAEQADCLLLVDVNNIHVSSVNHGFDPLAYLRGLPPGRVQQIHLAGHSDMGDHLIDTHDHPVAQPVWDLYAQACRLFGPVPAMIERDARIPPLQTLLDELALARGIAAASGAAPPVQPQPVQAIGAGTGPTLLATQHCLAGYILDRGAGAGPTPAPAWPEPAVELLIRSAPGPQARQRLGIYHNAYRVRLAGALAESFAKTCLFMGTELFDREAGSFALRHPPLVRSLNRYGEGFAGWLAARYPANPELHELAQLDWDLRTRFDGADAPALDAALARTDSAALWLSRSNPLHPSVLLRPHCSNLAAIWQAIDACAAVPAPVCQAIGSTLIVWRLGLRPQFRTLAANEAQFIRRLADGQSINQACADLAGTATLSDPQQLGLWLRDWLDQGVLRAA